jgi:hypothetical protein
MKRKLIVKLVALNTVIVLINIIVFAGFKFSPMSDNKLIQAASITIIAMSVIIFFVFNYRLLSSAVDAPEANRQPVIEKEDYRDTLRKYRMKNPELDDEIDAAIEQMDSIDRKQLKLAEILKRNETPYESLTQTGEETEDVLYNNIRYILNRVTLWDEEEYQNPKKRHIYEQYLTQIKEVLNKNDEILNEFDTFLSEVSNIKNQVIESDSGLEATIDVLKSHYKNKAE